jgi:hypothetical protein
MRTGLSMGDKAFETEKRDSYVTRAFDGQHWIVWECQIRGMLRTTPEMRSFFDKHDGGLEPLRARMAFAGGRCAPTKLYHKCAPGERIIHLDMVSDDDDDDDDHVTRSRSTLFPWSLVSIHGIMHNCTIEHTFAVAILIKR